MRGVLGERGGVCWPYSFGHAILWSVRQWMTNVKRRNVGEPEGGEGGAHNLLSALKSIKLVSLSPYSLRCA